jgi:hypothetical protein
VSPPGLEEFPITPRVGFPVATAEPKAGAGVPEAAWFACVADCLTAAEPNFVIPDTLKAVTIAPVAASFAQLKVTTCPSAAVTVVVETKHQIVSAEEFFNTDVIWLKAVAPEPVEVTVLLLLRVPEATTKTTIKSPIAGVKLPAA